MSLGKCKLKIINKGKLSSGICDNCKCPEMIATGGNGINEPVYNELYCKKKKIFLEPQPPKYQIKECDCFDPI